MAIEIIPKKRDEKVSSIGNIVRYIGLGFLFLSIVVSATFFVLRWRIVQEIEKVRVEREAQKNPEILLLESEMRDYRRRVLDFAYILERRISPSPMFEVIERTIHPEVYLSDIQIDVSGKSIKTNGVAADIIAFDQQVKLFEKEEMIISSGISSFERKDDGRISFPMTIVFSDKLFNPSD